MIKPIDTYCIQPVRLVSLVDLLKEGSYEPGDHRFFIRKGRFTTEGKNRVWEYLVPAANIEDEAFQRREGAAFYQSRGGLREFLARFGGAWMEHVIHHDIYISIEDI